MSVCFQTKDASHRNLHDAERGIRTADHCLSFIDFFAVYDSGDEICLYYFLCIIVQEVAVVHRHIGKLAKLDGAYSVFLMELTRHVDGNGLQRLLAGDCLLNVALGVSVHENLG